MKPHLPKLLLAALLAICVGSANTAAAVAADGAVFGVTGDSSVTGDVSVTVDSGSTGDSWAAAVGVTGANDDNDLTAPGNVTMEFSGVFTGGAPDAQGGGGTTVFGIVNAGRANGDVTLIFNAADAEYGTFTTNGYEASVAGSYKGTIAGAFNATIAAGTFHKNILGGFHTAGIADASGAADTIGSTALTISGGSIMGAVYGGGITGSIIGNTAVTIVGDAGLAALKGSILSAGGTGGSIGGNATLTFNDIGTQDTPSSYTGSVEGASGASVAGSTALVVDNSHLSLDTVKDFDTINIAAGSSLKITGAITTDTLLSMSFDSETVATKTDNGLGAGVFSGLVTGDGEFTVENGVTTLNGKVISDTQDGAFVMADSMFYVMNTTATQAPVPPSAPRSEAVYSVGDGTEYRFSEVVHVGKHNYSGPAATEGANSAQGFYVGENGVLCIMGDSDTMLAGDILETTQGSGKIFLRSPGYTDVESDSLASALKIQVDSATKATGSVYLAPYEIADSAKPQGQPGVFLHLADGADITSFSEVHYGYPQSQIVVDGHIGANEAGAHINNLTAKGCGTVIFAVDAGANDSLVLGGDTSLGWYEHGDGSKQPVTLHVDINHANSHLTIESLTGGEPAPDSNYISSNVYFTTSEYDFYPTSVDSVTSVVDINSFDYRGYIYLKSANERDSVSLNINLESDQYIQDSQLIWSLTGMLSSETQTKPPYEGSVDVTLTGSGTYVLSDGNAIYMNPTKNIQGDYQRNFAVLSDDWTGTVEVNNLVAMDGLIQNEQGIDEKKSSLSGIDFDDYGNAQSTIHFKGFEGHVFNTGEDNKYLDVEIRQDLILTNSSNMSAFKLSNGYEGQQLQFLGNISGTGDFVLNTTKAETIHLKGDISQWAADGTETPEFIVQQGEQTLNLSDKATELNANLRTKGGTLNANISNTAAVTVNSTVSHADGGTLNLKIDTAAGTTFNNAVDVSKLELAADSSANFNAAASAGNVNINTRESDSPAVLSNGIVVTGNSIVGGSAQDAEFAFTTSGDNIVSNVQLTNVTLSSVANSEVELCNVSATDVYLSGKGVTYLATESVSTFTLVTSSASLNQVRFETDILSGMTLSAESSLTLAMDNAISGWDAALADAADTNVDLFLKGFTLEILSGAGDNSGLGWPSDTLIFAPNGSTLSDFASVASLLNAKYDSVSYHQAAEGLHIQLYNVPIPEPTTATLSLLALAALAARRRRK